MSECPYCHTEFSSLGHHINACSSKRQYERNQLRLQESRKYQEKLDQKLIEKEKEFKAKEESLKRKLEEQETLYQEKVKRARIEGECEGMKKGATMAGNTYNITNNVALISSTDLNKKNLSEMVGLCKNFLQNSSENFKSLPKKEVEKKLVEAVKKNGNQLQKAMISLLYDDIEIEEDTNGGISEEEIQSNVDDFVEQLEKEIEAVASN